MPPNDTEAPHSLPPSIPAASEVSGNAPDSASRPPQIVVVPVAIVPVPVPVPVVVPVPVAPSSRGNGVPAEPASALESEPAARSENFGIVPARKRPPGAISAFWRKFGGAGFVVSALFHFALMAGALLWIVSKHEFPRKPEIATFVSGAGGASASVRENFSKKNLHRRPPTEAPKILVKTQKTKIALPEMPKLAAPKNFAATGKIGGNASGGGNAASGNDAAGNSGFGGGLGAGTGIGLGGGKNHLAKFKTLLGAKIRAQRIAVFLDCSGSMRSFLPAVKEEIYEKFPDADVFAFSGTGIEVRDGEILGGKNMKAKTLAGIRKKRADDETDVAKLSGAARVIHRKYAEHFAAGTAGAWLDVFSRERYDALVVFSDFRDGIRQRRGDKTVFADSSYSPTPDARDARERKWEADWLAAFSRAGAPKLYLFSVRAQPQEFLRKCVSASGGEITVLDLKKKNR